MKVTIIGERWVGTNLLVCMFCWDCGKAFSKHTNWVEYAINTGHLIPSGRSSAVEREHAKLQVAGSIPAARSNNI